MKSFAELDSVKHHGDHTHQLKEVESMMSSIDGVLCLLCTGDIDLYYQQCKLLININNKIKVIYIINQ